MKKKIKLIPLFKKFIRESETGKRRKLNGEKLKKGSIENYYSALKLIERYCEETNFEFRICDANRLNQREFVSEKRYWKSFYTNYSNYLYKSGCHDNYVGTNFKHIRTFFNYLKKEKNINVGEFHKTFYVRKHEIDIKVLTPERLKFLIHDKEFETCLTINQQKIKDVFVFGCTTGLRFSDLEALTIKNFEFIEETWYVKVRTKKTKTYSLIKLPDYAANIFLKYKTKYKTRPLFQLVCLDNFNKQLKKIGRKAGWTENAEHYREKLGKAYKVKMGSKQKTAFYDFMSSHMMRRTAITTMLILGMPEHLVRTVSGHTNNSQSFYKYVHYAQSYTDKEISKVHDKLANYG